MRQAAIVAYGAVSAAGVGVAALGAAGVGARSRARSSVDPELVAAGITRPVSARVPGLGARPADALLWAALDACVAELGAVSPGWRGERVGLSLGTTSGAMQGASRAYITISTGRAPAPADAEDLAYGAPFVRARARLGLALTREAHVLGACASSALALGLGALWLDADECDVVLVGGYDAVTPFVAAGFAALGAVTRATPRPFREGRDGLALGDGAAVLALRASSPRARGWVSGFGAASDARHLTAPDRDARGLVRACRAALASARLEAGDVGLVSAHGTATVFNDAAEARAFVELFGAEQPPVHALKGELGHTLGAAGALEVLAATEALRAGTAPPSAGDGARDPGASARVLDVGEPCSAEHALKTSLAFGGLDVALVLSRDAGERGESERRGVEVRASVHVALGDVAAALALVPPERAARWDDVTRLVVEASARLAARAELRRGDDVAIVVGHVAATVTTNTIFAARHAGGRPEPRRFPFTSPNACAGEASSVLGLVGAAFAVGGAPRLEAQARQVARDLVAHGVASAAIAIEVDDASDATRALADAWGDEPRSAGARGILLVGVGAAQQRSDLLDGSHDRLVAEHGGLVEGHPGERGGLGRVDPRSGAARRDEPVAHVEVLVRGLALARGDQVHVEVEGSRRGRMQREADDPGLLERLTRRDHRGIGLVGLSVAARLQPALELAMKQQQQAQSVGVEHERGAGEVPVPPVAAKERAAARDVRRDAGQGARLVLVGGHVAGELRCELGHRLTARPRAPFRPRGRTGSARRPPARGDRRTRRSGRPCPTPARTASARA